MPLNTTEELITAMAQGEIVILMDAEDRENEGDFVFAADKVTPEHINFLVTHGRGLVCMPISQEKCEQLGLQPVVRARQNIQRNTFFTQPIEAATGVSTGISAADRAHTIKTAAAINARPEDLIQPGHIFPIMAQPGGVLVREGHTEASCDLARLAGHSSAAVIVEILSEDGTMARQPELIKVAKKHGLKIGTIADLVSFRRQHDMDGKLVYTKEKNNENA